MYQVEKMCLDILSDMITEVRFQAENGFTLIYREGALLLLGKDVRILILVPDMSKNKAPTSVPWNFSFWFS